MLKREAYSPWLQAPYVAPQCRYAPVRPVQVLDGSVTGGNPETWDDEEDDSGNW